MIRQEYIIEVKGDIIMMILDLGTVQSQSAMNEGCLASFEEIFSHLKRKTSTINLKKKERDREKKRGREKKNQRGEMLKSSRN